MSQKDFIGIDIGNSRLKVARVCDGGIERHVSVKTHPISGLFDRLHRELSVEKWTGQCRSAIICSVCSEADLPVCKSLEKLNLFEKKLFLKHSDIPLCINSQIKKPQQIGIDRILNAYAALKLYGKPCIVISAGTAITVDLIDASGEFKGGAIGPGFRLSLQALTQGTSRLPCIDAEKPARTCGINTAEAMQSGVYHFCGSGVKTLVQKFAENTSRVQAVVVTGGDGELLDLYDCHQNVVFNSDLLFMGMWRLFRKYSGVNSNAKSYF